MNGLANQDLSAEEQALLVEIKADPERTFPKVFSYYLKRLEERDNKIVLLEAKVAKLEEEKRLDRARRFGASSEVGDHQYRLFDEAEGHRDEPNPEKVEPCELIEVPAYSKRKPKRKPLPANLTRVRVKHDLEDADKVCTCGSQMHIIGRKSANNSTSFLSRFMSLNITGRRIVMVSVTNRSKRRPWRHSPSLKVWRVRDGHVTVAKYADGLPLYRQSKQFARLGIDLPRNTLASHMIKGDSYRLKDKKKAVVLTIANSAPPD